MKCYYHTDRESVAQCTDCGKALCKQCASHYEIPLCKDCATNRNGNLKSIAFKNLAWLGLAFVIAIIFQITKFGGDMAGGFAMYLLWGFMFGGTPVGWKVLNKITPSIFLWLPVIGWVIYFVIKLTLAFLIGWVAMPIRIIKGFVQYSKARKNQQFIEKSYK